MTQALDEFLAMTTEENTSDGDWLADQPPTDYEPKPKGEKKNGGNKGGRKQLGIPAWMTQRIDEVVPFSVTAPDAKAARAVIYKVRNTCGQMGRGLHVDSLTINGDEVKQAEIALNGEYGDYLGSVVVGFIPQPEPDKRRTGRKSV